MSESKNVLKALAFSEIFASADISGVSHFIKHFKRGEKISEMQSGIDCVGILLSGSATVGSDDEHSISVAKAGHEFGICNIFVNNEMPTVMTARVGCSVLFIPKEEFARLLADDSAMMFRYVRVCNEKMIYLAEKLRLMSVPTCKGRVAMWLLSNADTKIISKDELARQLGISRASLFRVISEFENGGIISVHNTITVKNEAALRACIR